jgi:hypothetical protein
MVKGEVNWRTRRDVAFANAWRRRSCFTHRIDAGTFDKHFNLNARGAYFTAQKRSFAPVELRRLDKGGAPFMFWKTSLAGFCFRIWLSSADW